LTHHLIVFYPQLVEHRSYEPKVTVSLSFVLLVLSVSYHSPMPFVTFYRVRAP